MRDIGKNIKALRQRSGMTQEELAEKLFVTRQTVSNYELGRSRPDVEMVVKLAQVLGTDANTVLYGIPTSADRKQELLRLCIAGGALAAMYLLYGYLAKLTQELRSQMYIVLPWGLLNICYVPTLCLTTGWTLMQQIGCFTALSPIRSRASRWIRLGTLCFMGMYIVVMVPVVLALICRWQLPAFWWQLVVTILGANPDIEMIFGHETCFFLSGIVLWMFRSPLSTQK